MKIKLSFLKLFILPLLNFHNSQIAFNYVLSLLYFSPRRNFIIFINRLFII